jgi:hypothetical protein
MNRQDVINRIAEAVGPQRRYRLEISPELLAELKDLLVHELPLTCLGAEENFLLDFEEVIIIDEATKAEKLVAVTDGITAMKLAVKHGKTVLKS